MAEHAHDLSQVKSPQEDVVPKSLVSSGKVTNLVLPPGGDSDDMNTSTTFEFVQGDVRNENSPSASTASIAETFAYTNVSHHEAYSSSYSFHDMGSTETNAFQESTLFLPVAPPMNDMPDGLLTNLPSDPSIFIPHLYDSPESMNFFTHQEFENSVRQPVFDQHGFDSSMSWPLTSTESTSDLGLADQSTWNFFDGDFPSFFGSNVLESSCLDLHAPMNGEHNTNDHLMANSYNPLSGMSVAENSGGLVAPTNEAVRVPSYDLVSPTGVKEQCSLLGFDIDSLLDFK